MFENPTLFFTEASKLPHKRPLNGYHLGILHTTIAISVTMIECMTSVNLMKVPELIMNIVH
jgi:hypothetical protein